MRSQIPSLNSHFSSARQPDAAGSDPDGRQRGNPRFPALNPSVNTVSRKGSTGASVAHQAAAVGGEAVSEHMALAHVDVS